MNDTQLEYAICIALLAFGAVVGGACGYAIGESKCKETNPSSMKSENEKPTLNGYVSVSGIDLGEDERMKDRQAEMRRIFREMQGLMAEMEKLMAEDPDMYPVGLRLKNGEYHVFTRGEIAWLEQRYPGVSVQSSIVDMAEWCENNPSRRKTERGIDRFVKSWLKKESTKAGGAALSFLK